MEQNTFKIEKKVPQPASRVSGESKYPFSKMAVGDSFACDRIVLDRVRVAAFNYGKRHNMKFMTHRQGDGARVWRIE